MMIDFSKTPLFLAPLAGFSDLPLRKLVKNFSCDVTTSEMLSANALAYKSEKTFTMLQKADNEEPYIAQIEGSSPEIIKKAVLVLNDFEHIDGIDLNCGCPVPKVVKQNSGSALLLDLDNLVRIAETIKTYSNKKYTSVKIRLGFDEKYPEKIIQALNKVDLDYIAIHGRTRAGGYSAKVDYQAIRRAKELSLAPIIANGDISSENYKEVLKESKADALMIGRASIGKPWLFHEIKYGKKVDEAKKKEIILTHFDAMLEHYGKQGSKIFRKHLHEYSKGRREAASFRVLINQEQNEEKLRLLIEEFFS